MKKTLLLAISLFIVSTIFAQQDVKTGTVKPESVKQAEPHAEPVKSPPANPAAVKQEKYNSVIKGLMADRDTLKSKLKAKNSEFTKDNSRLTKLENEKSKLKEQLKAAKHAKKTDKAEAIQAKIVENTEALDDLNPKLKAEDKEISALEKELKQAEKELKTAKETQLKEKHKK